MIEKSLPLKEISEEAAREKSIRHGNISTLHIWWARRPLAACRAAVLGSLLHNPDELISESLQKFIAKICTWEAVNDAALVQKAQRLILEQNGKTPRLLDCFAGGGSIPLESLRAGCETYALELNPVAVLIELCTLVFPQKYGRTSEVHSTQTNMRGKQLTKIENQLTYDVRRWASWVYEEAQKEIGNYYPGHGNRVPLAYLWARTIPCPNPDCRATIPLIKQLWLANKPKRKIALKMLPDYRNKAVKFEIIEANKKIDFDPKQGTIRLGSVRCPVCNQGTYDKFEIKKAAKVNGLGLQPLVVVRSNEGQGRVYEPFSKIDMDAFLAASSAVEKLTGSKLDEKLTLIPDEPISTDYDWVIKPPMFGLTRWGDLFNPRQALSLSTFAVKVRSVYPLILAECKDKEYARVVTTYLALGVDRLVDKNATACLWNSPGEKLEHVFGRQAIPMSWDYGELNPFSGQMGDWTSAIEWICGAIEHCSSIEKEAKVVQGSATRLPFPDGYFDAIITDPPYYDAVPYSDLSDFFYVWLKRTVGYLYPDLFGTLLAPKADELVEQSGKVASAPRRKKDQQFYQTGMTKALSEVWRVLGDKGICVIAFAHKTTIAWEKLIKAILDSSLTVTASWPLHTEMSARLRARGSAALASSVWLVCRKRALESRVASWKKVQVELDGRVKEKLDEFLTQNIKGADALLSAIGPALEVYGRYERVEKVTGDAVTVQEFLDKVREVVAHHALTMVLSEQELGKLDSETAFYVLWKWTFEPGSQPRTGEEAHDSVESDTRTPSKGRNHNGGKVMVPFDDALKLARSVGAEPDILIKTRKLLEQEKENVYLMGPEDRKKIHGLGEVDRDGTPPAIIDMIHRAVNLWADQQYNKLDEYLKTSGATTNDTFRKVSQALSNLLPLQSREKQLLDGLLGRHSEAVETSLGPGTRTLDEFSGDRKKS